MVRKHCTYRVILLILFLSSAPLAAQSGSAKCAVRVTEPQAGQKVAGGMIVEGTATLPGGHHLWVFARPVFNFRTLELWWPQGEGFVKAGSWKLPATFGTQQNIGHEFDITAAVFAQKEHDILVEYVKKSTKSGTWEPIEIPASVCAAKMVTVTRTK